VSGDSKSIVSSMLGANLKWRGIRASTRVHERKKKDEHAQFQSDSLLGERACQCLNTCDVLTTYIVRVGLRKEDRCLEGVGTRVENEARRQTRGQRRGPIWTRTVRCTLINLNSIWRKRSSYLRGQIDLVCTHSRVCEATFLARVDNTVFQLKFISPFPSHRISTVNRYGNRKVYEAAAVSATDLPSALSKFLVLVWLFFLTRTKSCMI